MTTSRERVIRTLNHQPVDRAPRDLWTPAAATRAERDEIDDLLLRFPRDIVAPESAAGCGPPSPHDSGENGEYADPWGCVWRLAAPPAGWELVLSPLSSGWSGFRPPAELLDRFDRDRVNRHAAGSSQFVLAVSGVRPFERLAWLRGTEAALADIARGNGRGRKVLGLLHEFFSSEIELWASTGVDGVAFGDGWPGGDWSLLSVDRWRRVLKPLYRDYCRILHAADKFVFFRSAGRIEGIVDDLVEIGVDAVHARVGPESFSRLAEELRGRLTLWTGLDDPAILSQGSPNDVRLAVDRLRRALDFGRGGLIAQCDWQASVPWRNVAALFDRWQQPMLAHA